MFKYLLFFTFFIFSVTSHAAVYVHDTFTAANGTQLRNRTPSPTSPGNNYADQEFGGNCTSGVCFIDNNEAEITATFRAVGVDVGVSDFQIEIDWITHASEDNDAQIHYRTTDAIDGEDNGWAVMLDTTDDDVIIRRRIAAANNDCDIQTYDFTPGDTYAIKVIADGNNHYAYVNNVLIAQCLGDATHNTNTIVGFGSRSFPGGEKENFDNFIVQDIVASDTEAPQITSGPTLVSKDQDSANFSLTLTDSTPTITACISVFSNGNGSGASTDDVENGTGTGYIANTNSCNSGISSGGSTVLATGNVLTAGTFYDACFMAEDSVGTPNESITPVCVNFTPSISAAHLVTDPWTGSEDASVHVPPLDYNSAGAWIEGKRTPSAVAPNGTVGSGVLTITTSGGTVERDVGTPEVAIITDFTPGDVSGKRAGILVRKTTDGNHLECYYHANSNLIKLLQYDTGNPNKFTEIDSVAFTFTALQTYKISMLASDDNIVCAINDNPKITASSSYNNSASIVGLVADAANSVFDNTYVMTTRSGVDPDTGFKNDDPQGVLNSKSGIESGDIVWLDEDDLPDTNYQALNLYEGGTIEYTPETSFTGDDVMAWKLYDASAQIIESIPLTMRMNATTPPAAPQWAGSCGPFSWTLNVDPGSFDLRDCMTDVGTPPSELTCSQNTIVLPTGRVLSGSGNCILTGAPTADDGTSPGTFDASNATGTDTSPSISFTVSAPSGNPPVCSDFPSQYLEKDQTLTSLNMSQYCSDATSYSCGTLANGLNKVGAVISGVVTSVQIVRTNCTISNASGSINKTWRVEVWPSGSLCDSGGQYVRAAPRTVTRSVRSVAGRRLIRSVQCTPF